MMMTLRLRFWETTSMECLGSVTCNSLKPRQSQLSEPASWPICAAESAKENVWNLVTSNWLLPALSRYERPPWEDCGGEQ